MPNGMVRTRQGRPDSATAQTEVEDKVDGHLHAISDPAMHGSSGTSDLALIVTGNGSVSSVLQNFSEPSKSDPERLAQSNVSVIWPGELGNRILDCIKRTLRHRRVYSEEIEDVSRNLYCEFLFVAQGRNSVMLVARDISATRSAMARMRRLAYIDEVTGLFNRDYFVSELHRIVEALRLKEGRAGVICFEIGQPDVYGDPANAAGQSEILKELAARINNGLRGVNRSEELDDERYSIAARIDYRQFGVVLPKIGSGDDAEAVTQRLIESLQQPIRIGERTIRVTARAGIGLYPQDGHDAITLFANSISAMQDATENQMSSYKLHSGTVRVRALQRQDLELELRSALENGEFELNYLPILDATTHAVCGVEALLRWPKASFSSTSIDKVITLAEHTGLIVPIGEWVLREGCRQLAEWRANVHPSLRLAVNLSVQEFARADLAERIGAIIAEYAITPENIALEITEHMLFRDAIKGYSTCTEINALGTELVVDDFGTGACSLAHLSHAPIGAVKIDNSIVARSETDKINRATCAAVTAMAHELGFKVIAEGVETADQARMLQEQGCDFLQGFLFCKPLPASEFQDYLNKISSEHFAQGVHDE